MNFVETRLKQFQQEWRFFWRTVFRREKPVPEFLEPQVSRQKTSRSLYELSRERQSLHRRLEDIEKALASEKSKERVVGLHDEAQKLSEKIQAVSDRINQLREPSVTKST